MIVQELLVETAKKQALSGKRAFAQALVWIMAKDREEGLALKQNNPLHGKATEIRCNKLLFKGRVYFRQRITSLGV